MESVLVRDAATGRQLVDRPIPFVSIPQKGELIATQRQLWQVVRVVHAWRAPDLPVVWVDVSPAAAVDGTGGGPSPF